MAGEFFSIPRIKIFIVCSNVALLLIGTCIFILGLKMKWALAGLLLNAPSIAKTFKAVISTGFTISVAGFTGIIGALCEILWLILVHFFFLSVIVIMEFSLGVALMVIRSTIESYVESPECNNSCAATLDAIVLNYALPSSGVMITSIIVEGLMIYSTARLYLSIRDSRKNAELVSTTSHNIPMQNVSASQSVFPSSTQLNYTPSPSYIHRAQSRLSSYSPFLYHSPQLIYKATPQHEAALNQQPPSYLEVVPSANRNPIQGLYQSMTPTHSMTPTLNST